MSMPCDHTPLLQGLMHWQGSIALQYHKAM